MIAAIVRSLSAEQTRARRTRVVCWHRIAAAAPIAPCLGRGGFSRLPASSIGEARAAHETREVLALFGIAEGAEALVSGQEE